MTIANVTPNGPADKAGLKTGDTIVSVNGKTVETGDELVAEISALKPGTDGQARLRPQRQDEHDEVTIADRSKLFATRLGDEDEGGEEAKPQESKFGITVRDITPDMADRYKLPRYKGRDGAGREAGRLRRHSRREPRRRHPGNQQAAGNSEDDFQKLQSQLKSGADVVFLVRPRGTRDNTTVFMGGTLP